MRLIDADALMADIRQNSESYFADDFAHEWVDKQPTVALPSAQPERCEDCVNFSKTRLLIPQPEIIRCKDCKYAEVADTEDSQDGYTCQFHRGSIWFSGSYCSWAERKSE